MILDVREAKGLETTNLQLQKLLYFCHAEFLMQTKSPLVKGVFEAWRNGPVNQVVYKAFKDAGKNPITKRARKRNYIAREYEEFDESISEKGKAIVEDTVRKLSQLTAWQLVDLSHATNGPWDYIVKSAQEGIVAGMRIPDDVTIRRYKYLKLNVGVDALSRSANVPLRPFEKR